MVKMIFMETVYNNRILQLYAMLFLYVSKLRRFLPEPLPNIISLLYTYCKNVPVSFILVMVRAYFHQGQLCYSLQQVFIAKQQQ